MDLADLKATKAPIYTRDVVETAYHTPKRYFMLSKPGDSGRLMRLMDVVAWLMDACDLPLKHAVKAVCDAFEDKGSYVFILSERDYAKPISNANAFDGRPLFLGDDRPDSPKTKIGWPGALEQMRYHWPSGLRVSSLCAVGLREVAVTYDLVCALFVAPAADANTPYQPQTLDDVVKARTGPRKGTEWLAEEIAILRATYQQSLTYQQIADRFGTDPDTGKPYITGKRIGQLIRTDLQKPGKRQQNRLNKAA